MGPNQHFLKRNIIEKMMKVYHNKGNFCFCCRPVCVYTGSHAASSGLKSLKATGVHGQISVKIACGKAVAWVATTPFHPWNSCIRPLWTWPRGGQKEWSCAQVLCVLNQCRYSLKNSVSHLVVGRGGVEMVTVTHIIFAADTEPS